ncbi:TPA: inositol monophosphatase [Candidatus Edwardsbacteria bacterium]|nr:inositol monophosphatase [Candidatus Edwardsbacteria bacterium]
MYEKELQTAVAAAMQAGALLMKMSRGKLSVKYKSPIDLVTGADRASEALIISIIRKAFPGDDIMTEESRDQRTSSKRRWIIDPLDGTTNYAHGFPAAAVSIGFSEKGVIKAGGVYDPFRKELFLAERGRGSFVNGRRLAVSKTPSVSKALLVTGFPYDRAERAEFYCRFLAEFMKLSHDVRRMGSASLDLCWLAAGRTDGYWEYGLKPWDVAAGKLILEEAGGKVTDFSGARWKVEEKMGSQTLATNGRVHAAMLAVIKRIARAR